jgi:cephalosporin hydroxylase
LEIEIPKDRIYNYIQRMKYLGMRCIKYVQDLYAENYKALLREIERRPE